MESVGTLLVAGIPLLLTIFLVTAGIIGKSSPTKLRSFTGGIFGLAWLAGVAAFILVLFNGTINFSLISVTVNSTPVPIFGFLADHLSLIIALLVITVSGIVHLYSVRAMQEERNFGRYFTLLTLVTLEVLLVVLSNNLFMLAIFWILKGLTLTFLLSHYDDRPQAWHSAFIKLRIDFIGTGAMLLALGQSWRVFGTFDIVAINNFVTRNPEKVAGFDLTLLTLLFFIAAMAKSAQFPFHSWLPQTVEAPTPVSALMHAGLVNAGGFLLIRLSPIFVAAPVTLWVVVAIGAVTTIYGTTIMLARTDVKGMLVYSTIGQMGFMMVECGLGAYGLAVIHIVAHGLFKATLFLSAGSAIQQKALVERFAPKDHAAHTFSVAKLVAGSLFAGALLFTIPQLLGYAVTTDLILLAFAWITVSYALPKIGKLSAVILFPGLAAFIFVYVLVTHAATEFLKPAIAVSPLSDPLIIFAITGGLIAVGAVALILQNSTSKPAWLTSLMKKLYVQTLFTGYGRGF